MADDTPTKGAAYRTRFGEAIDAPVAFAAREATDAEAEKRAQQQKAEIDRRVEQLRMQAAVERRVEQLRMQAAVDRRVEELRRQGWRI
jgi:hypothetical protein